MVSITDRCFSTELSIIKYHTYKYLTDHLNLLTKLSKKVIKCKKLKISNVTKKMIS